MIKDLLQKVAVRKDIMQMLDQQAEFWNIQRKISPSLVEEKKDHIVIHWCSVKEFYWLVANVFG